MNIINKFFLKLILLPTALYRRMGVDTYRLSSILVMKLMMDDRRVSAFRQVNKKSEKPVKAGTLITMFISLMMGLFFLSSFFYGENHVLHLTFFFGLFMFMLAGLLIADFTSVLIDVRDNQIILPKPVDEKTFTMARLLHILIHISKLVIPMTLPTLVYLALAYSAVQMLVAMLFVALATLFVIFCINGIYILVLKITTPSKFQSILSYFQIFFAIFIYGGYQFIPRLLGRSEYANIDINHIKYFLIAPPYWFACAVEYFSSFSGNTQVISGAALALVAPLLSIYIVIKYFAPQFTRKLSMITAVDVQPSLASKDRAKPINNNRWLAFWSNILTARGAERAGFNFTAKMTSRSRDFRIRVYPAIGYIVVFIALMFYQHRALSMEAIENETMRGRVVILSAIYFSCFLLVVAVAQITFSEKYKAAWIYFITPIKHPGHVISGAAKAAIVKFYLPLAIATLIAGIWLIGLKFIPNFIFGMSNVLLAAYIIIHLTLRQFPFSKPENNNAKNGRWLRQLAVMVIPFALFILQMFVYKMMVVVIICAIISIASVWLLASGIRQMSWTRLRQEYED